MEQFFKRWRPVEPSYSELGTFGQSRPVISGQASPTSGEAVALRQHFVDPHTMSAWCGLAVYPRACGGNDVLHVFKGAKAGLSPRVRGNLVLPSIYPSRNRSIPARTGEPGVAINLPLQK